MKITDMSNKKSSISAEEMKGLASLKVEGDIEKHGDIIIDDMKPMLSIETDENQCNYGLSVDPQYARKMSVQ